MKLRKIISKGLVIGLLFNSGISSFAGILSEDERYETLEGNNISVNDILEEDKANLEIEASTLVNTLYGDFINSSQLATLNIIMNGVESKLENQAGALVIGKNAMLKDNTKYTLVADIKTNLEKISYAFKNSENFSQGALTEPVEKNDEYYKIIKVLTTTSECTMFGIGNHSSENPIGSYLNIENLMLLEGDWTNKELPGYFEGMKSVENDVKIINKKENKNKFKLYEEPDFIKNATYKMKNESLYITQSEEANGEGSFVGWSLYTIPGNTYTFSAKYRNKYNAPIYLRARNLDGSNQWVSSQLYVSNTEGEEVLTFVAEQTKTYFLLYAKVFNIEGAIGNTVEWYDIQVEESNVKTDYEKNFSMLDIKLEEPLNGINEFKKDRIININNSNYIEKNCRHIVFDGDENWGLRNAPNGTTITKYIYDVPLYKNANSENDTNIKAVSNRFIYDNSASRAKDWSIKINRGGTSLILRTDDKLDNLNDLKQYLKNNPLEIVYVLEKPYYIKLNNNISLDIYEGSNIIKSNNPSLLNIKITIDRALNKALEAIEVVKENPTVDNIAKARMWVNLLKESTRKDDLNNQINDMTEIEDLEVELKKVTSNMDVYIKSQNGLSMSLSTNSIIFDEFDSTEDMEKLNAVNLTINSSLPYRLNSYMMTELKNDDNTEIIPKELFNIRLNGEADYKAFSDINEKLVLKEDCSKGNNNQFNIDLILKGSLTHKADIYKTTIKFEAEQK